MEATEVPAECQLLRQEIEELKAKNTSLQHNLDDALSEVAVAGCVREDLMELERQRTSLEAEKTTLESLLIEAQNEATSTRTRYEHENARVRAVLDQLETENRELKARLVSDNLVPDGSANLETLSVLTDATKSLARRVRSNLLSSNSGGGSVSFSKQNRSDNDSDTSPTHDPTGMQKAYEDSELMKAIIVPLEEQIVALKDKLRETDTMLREFEKHQSDVLFSAEVLGKWLVGKKSFSEAMEELEKKSQESSVAFSALLNARLGLVIKELSELRLINDRNATDLDRTLKKSADLRSQAAEANGRLLRSQQKHAAELARVASVLSEEQKLALSASFQKQNSLDKGNNLEDKMLSDEIVICKSEWEALQDELNKTKALMGIGLDVDVVGSDQFRQLQSQLHELQAKSEKNLAREEKLKSDLQVMEQQWNERAEEHQSQTAELTAQVRESKELLSALQRSYKSSFDESRAHLHKLTQDRDRIVSELRRLQVISNFTFLDLNNVDFVSVYNDKHNLDF